MPVEVISRSEAQTAALAAAVASLLKPGDVVFLTGQLGTGKTFFIRAAARELGVSGPVTSPSFTMGQTYSGRTRVHHLDLYRLREFGPEDAVDFEPFFEDDAITFVEWPERAAAYLDKPAVDIRIDHVDVKTRGLTFRANKDLIKTLEKLIAGSGY